ncbi:MAG: hypothetical protein JRN17_02360 [Nitrososphaerota archaeon]|nr:hypothetical protein [Nitrososphaerota archaeon]
MRGEEAELINLRQDSQTIGNRHEEKVERLLRKMGLEEGTDYERHKEFKTKDGIKLFADFWLPKRTPGIIIECKTWGVAAKSPASSRRRKLQEAFFTLFQFRHFVRLTKGSRMIIVTGKENFDLGEEKFLRGELEKLCIVNISKKDELKKLLS